MHDTAEKKEFVCPKCGKQFRFRADLDRHLAIHMRNQCCLCDVTTVQLGEMKEHVLNAHQDYFEKLVVKDGEVDLSDSRTFELLRMCAYDPICRRYFKYFSHMMAHAKAAHEKLFAQLQAIVQKNDEEDGGKKAQQTESAQSE